MNEDMGKSLWRWSSSWSDAKILMIIRVNQRLEVDRRLRQAFVAPAVSDQGSVSVAIIRTSTAQEMGNIPQLRWAEAERCPQAAIENCLKTRSVPRRRRPA